MRCLRPLHQGRGYCHGASLHEPQVIVCDELGTPGDAEAVAQGVASGVVFFATVHCDDPAGLRKKPALAALLDTRAFAKAAFLSGRSRPGAVAQWVTL